jgi:hypothetical protein
MRPLRTKELIISTLIDWYIEGRQSDELTELVTAFGNDVGGADPEMGLGHLEDKF